MHRLRLQTATFFALVILMIAGTASVQAQNRSSYRTQNYSVSLSSQTVRAYLLSATVPRSGTSRILGCRSYWSIRGENNYQGFGFWFNNCITNHIMATGAAVGGLASLLAALGVPWAWPVAIAIVGAGEGTIFALDDWCGYTGFDIFILNSGAPPIWADCWWPWGFR